MTHPFRVSAAPCETRGFRGSGGVGLLVVGHGTADRRGAQETREVAREAFGLLPELPMELGFLEVIGPSIEDAVQSLRDQGCNRLVVAPLLLFTAGHAVRDVPEAVLAAVTHRGMTAVQSAALGCHPCIIELSQARRREAVAECSHVSSDNTVLVMVGRGSSAPDAVAQFRSFAESSIADGGITSTRLEIGFVAAARPTLEESLEAAAAARPRRVIVQPHVLFQGHVENQVTSAVTRYRIVHPDIEWVQVSRLGADRLVARALVDRAVEAIRATGIGEALFLAPKNVSPETD